MRLQMIVVSSLLCLLILGGLMVNEHDTLMWDTRVAKLRSITDEAVSMAADLQRRVQAGALSRDQAIQQFRDMVRPIRYDEEAGYLFAYGMDARRSGPDQRHFGKWGCHPGCIPAPCRDQRHA
jgi:methyl-accepting chemotaxis protein